jgi:SOS-response transcriptional repressor LexA
MIDWTGFYERAAAVIGAKNAPEMARKLNMSKQAVYGWQKGKPPGIETIAWIAESTNTSLEWLLTGRGPQAVPGRGPEADDSLTIAPDPEVLIFLNETAVEKGETPARAAEALLREALVDKGIIRQAGQGVSVVFYGTQNMEVIRVMGEIENGEITRYQPMQLDRVAAEFNPTERDARAFRARGDSLSEAEIYHGDLVIYFEQFDAPNGAVVIADTPERVVVRTLYKKLGDMILRARQIDKEDLVFPIEKVKIIGVVLGVQRATHAANESDKRA